MPSFSQSRPKSVANNLAEVTPPKYLQTDEQGPARKTQVLECLKASSQCWIKLLLMQWCAPAGKPLMVRPFCPPGSMMEPVMSVEWCGWSISSPRPSLEQGEWVFHH